MPTYYPNYVVRTQQVNALDGVAGKGPCKRTLGKREIRHPHSPQRAKGNMGAQSTPSVGRPRNMSKITCSPGGRRLLGSLLARWPQENAGEMDTRVRYIWRRDGLTNIPYLRPDFPICGIDRSRTNPNVNGRLRPQKIRYR